MTKLARITIVGTLVTFALAGAASAQTCPSVEGTWRNTLLDNRPATDLADWKLSQEGCRVTGFFYGAGRTQHFVSADLNGEMTIVRTTIDGCEAFLFGRLLVVGGGLRMEMGDTSGNCNLPRSLAGQTRVWARSSSLAPIRTTIDYAGSYRAPQGWDRGKQSTAHCGNNPESWVRASASLDQSSGVLRLDLQLETDSTRAGPIGKASVSIRDADGRTLAVFESEEIGIGGKAPGDALRRTFSSTVARVSADVARNARLVFTDAQCTGFTERWFNVTEGQVRDAFGLIRLALGGE